MKKRLRLLFVSKAVLSLLIVLVIYSILLTVGSYSFTLGSRYEKLSEIATNGEFAKNLNDPKNFITDFEFDMYIIKSDKSGVLNFNSNIPYEDVESYVDINILSDVYYKALETGETKGAIGDYLYVLMHRDDGNIIVISYAGILTETFNKILIYGYSVFFLTLILFTVVSIWVSNRAVKPIVQVYKKQQQFITDASHELKTPLAIINSNADVLILKNEDSKWVQGIKTQVSRMTNLVDDLLSLAELDEKNVEIKGTKFDLTSTVNGLVKHFEPVATSKQKPIVAKIEDNINYVGDEKAIQKIFSILLENAIKYGTIGKEITLSVKKQKKDVVIHLVNYADNLEKKNYNVLLERFYRLDSSRNSETGGTGIGLSILNSLILKHKGTINIFSKDAKRIEFEINM